MLVGTRKLLMYLPLIALMMVSVAFAGCGDDDDDLPPPLDQDAELDAELPDVEIPDVELPDGEVTDVEITDTEVPDVEITDVEVPDVEPVDDGGLDVGTEPTGFVTFSDINGPSSTTEFNVFNLEAPEGALFGWLTSNTNGADPFCVGPITLTDGDGSAERTKPETDEDIDLIFFYNRARVTDEASDATCEGLSAPSTTVILEGTIPSEAKAEITKITTTASDTPENRGYGNGMVQQLAGVLYNPGEALDQAITAAEADDFDTAREIAEGVYNLLVGTAAEEDLNGDTTITNLGNGFGIIPLPAEEQIGYPQAASDAAQAALDITPTTQFIQTHGARLIAAATDTISLAELARTAAQEAAIAADGEVETGVNAMRTAIGNLLDGTSTQDGAYTVFAEGQNMATIPLVEPTP